MPLLCSLNAFGSGFYKHGGPLDLRGFPSSYNPERTLTLCGCVHPEEGRLITKTMRTIALMLDWDSTLFFHDAEGQDRIDEATLPISAGLKSQLEEYYKQYSDLYLLDVSPRKVDPLDKRLLDDTGLQIWQQLLAEIGGSYRIIFFSEEFGEKFDDPKNFIATRDLRP